MSEQLFAYHAAERVPHARADRRRERVEEHQSVTAVVVSHLPLPPSPVEQPFDLSMDFPTIRVIESELEVDLDTEHWFGSTFDFWAFDRSLDDRAGLGFHVTLRTANQPRDLCYILTRCQRLFSRRNADSAHASFDRVLAEHHAVHDLTHPVHRVAYDRALDTWQWVLRLDPAADAAVQFAALFDSLEPIAVETERLRQDGRADVGRPRRAGGRLAERILTAGRIPQATVDRTCSLLARREQECDSRAAAVLDEADALSFLSFGSAGFFDYFSQRQCLMKIERTLERLGPRGRQMLTTIWLRPDVLATFRERGHII
jgi:hypothetical protein